ncbi:MAG: dihydroorotate dehydrogenase electron transfer subunit [Clostridia bacterium]|nr:dihydroorotate dehydrogenase electron transfer subunit [Clostridia bacterium]
MKETLLTITGNIPLTANVYRLSLRGEGLELHRPGQFVNIALAGRFLRRPISVFDQEGEELRLIYKTVGAGTDQLSRMRTGEKLNVLTGLGNGYDLSRAGEAPLLLGGGAGVPPLYLLARELLKAGKTVHAVLGFNTEAEVFGEADFRALGCEVTVVTADGSHGRKGFVTDAFPENYSYFFTCGPEPMLRAVYRTAKTDGQFSFEERMGCGFGACMGCSCRVKDPEHPGEIRYKRICREGPVLEKGEILWDA